MIITNKFKRGVFYERCSSLEIQSPNTNTIQAVSLDGFAMNEVCFTNEKELRQAVIAAFLYVYLKDEVILSEELCELFESPELQLPSMEMNYEGQIIIYSDIVVNGLIKAGYKEGLREDVLKFYERT